MKGREVNLSAQNKTERKSNQEWKRSFARRLLLFGVAIIKLVSKLPKTPAGFAIASQLIKAATSIGANFQEAQDASSMRDFIQKLSISLREAKETLYWLQVISLSGLLKEEELAEESMECQEITAILVSSIKSSKLRIVSI